MKPDWSSWEEEASEILGLDRTITSGNKWYDPGDAVTRGKSSWPVYMEAKYTTNQSYSIKSRDLVHGQQLADQLGKRFVMPIRLSGNVPPLDYAVVSLHDLAELIQCHSERGD